VKWDERKHAENAAGGRFPISYSVANRKLAVRAVLAGGLLTLLHLVGDGVYVESPFCSTSSGLDTTSDNMAV
jgi:hypothetical protein